MVPKLWSPDLDGPANGKPVYKGAGQSEKKIMRINRFRYRKVGEQLIEIPVLHPFARSRELFVASSEETFLQFP